MITLFVILLLLGQKQKHKLNKQAPQVLYVPVNKKKKI